MLDNYLSHHGILGQRWGVRRFQNADGTLTDAGKKRAIKQDRKRASKDRSLLSDDELDSRIKRLQKEKQLRELTEQELGRGKKFAGEALQNTGKQAIQKIAVEGAAAGIGVAVGVGVKMFLESQGIHTKM